MEESREQAEHAASTIHLTPSFRESVKQSAGGKRRRFEVA
jgi:ABC-type branched-subunit amino acid transport system ATPase component